MHNFHTCIKIRAYFYGGVKLSSPLSAHPRLQHPSLPGPGFCPLAHRAPYFLCAAERRRVTAARAAYSTEQTIWANRANRFIGSGIASICVALVSLGQCQNVRGRRRRRRHKHTRRVIALVMHRPAQIMSQISETYLICLA